MKKIMILGIFAIALTGCKFKLNYDFILDLNPPPPAFWEELGDDSELVITSVSQSASIDTVNFPASNPQGTATYMTFNSPTYEIIPETPSSVGREGNLILNFKFKIDSGDGVLIGGTDAEGVNRYKYRGSRTCTVNMAVNGMYDETEEILQLSQTDFITTEYARITCESPCELAGGDTACAALPDAGVPLSGLAYNLANSPNGKTIHFTDNEIDMTLSGDQYTDNEISFTLMIMDIVADIPYTPIATQYDITAQFQRP